MMPHAVVLLHHPVLGKDGDRITSAVTNLDIHDLARTSRTYGVERVYVVTPVKEQQRLVQRLLQHWCQGGGSRYNPHRAEALCLVRVCASLEEAMEGWRAHTGRDPLPILTGATQEEGLSYAEGRELAQSSSLMFLFGTAWGIDPALFARGWPVLKSIRGKGRYNHLPVRSAVAIALDRIFGEDR